MKIILNLVFAICCIGCGKQYVITQNSYYAPKKDRYQFKNSVHLPDSLALTTKAIYKKSDGNDFWLKFYPDGKVFYGHLSKIPKTLSERQSGFVGYYTLNGNKLKIELYYVQQWKWNYLILEGAIRSDSITFYSDHYRGHRRNIGHFTNGFAFVKSTESFAIPTPDW